MIDIVAINPKVVDISHYDDVETDATGWVGFRKLYAAGYRGVINKASQGRGIVDISYARRRPHAIAPFSEECGDGLEMEENLNYLQTQIN